MDAQPMDISRHVWETKYRYAGPGIAEHSIADIGSALLMHSPRSR